MAKAGPQSVLVAKRLRWRDYRTALGARPVKEFFDRLTDEEVAAVLLSLAGFPKKTQKTPARELELAERRLKDWRDRARRA